MILAADSHGGVPRCVITKEATVKALDAAHLIPAANGENDWPCNGITLRTDLHRLFDAGLFTLGSDGQVVNVEPGLSSYYRELLKDQCLPPATLNRVREMLALPQFRNRPPAL